MNMESESLQQAGCARAGDLQILSTAQDGEWSEALGRAAQHDFHHLAAYHRIAEERGEGTARLFAYREDEYAVALPLLLRPVEPSAPAGWQDATSVYGYGGPVASHDCIPAPVVGRFQSMLKAALVQRRVIAAFSRLHPLLSQHALLAGLGECRSSGQTVSIDLRQSPEQQRSHYRSALKNRINKLRRDGMVCVHDPEFRRLPDFIGIYHQTMRRVNADGSYFFEADYFERLRNGLHPGLNLFVAMVDGTAAAAGLFTICEGVVQYHLSGTADEFLKLSPMPLLVDTVRLWAGENGAHVFHLGGGVGSKEDSLFAFKAGFSKRRHSFATWRWVLAPEIYRALCEERLAADRLRGLEPGPADYFPGYRSQGIAAATPQS